MNDKELFFERGFTNNIKVELGQKLTQLQSLVYDLTKDLLIEHDSNQPIKQKIKLPFKTVPRGDSWSKIMNTVNESIQLKDVISSDEIKNTFKRIFSKPVLFEISAFRARFPEQSRVLYNWHQDEGTWFLSKKKNVTEKFPATLWLSINGSDEKNSIQVVGKTHKLKLFNHQWVDGQGFFKINNINKMIKEDDIHTVKTEESECLIFHPLTIHRSVPVSENIDLRPRYSLDIRYFDDNLSIKKVNVDFRVKLKKIFRGLI